MLGGRGGGWGVDAATPATELLLVMDDGTDMFRLPPPPPPNHHDDDHVGTRAIPPVQYTTVADAGLC